MYFTLNVREREGDRKMDIEVSRIEAVNGNNVCRRDASFNRDLHRCQSLFQRAAFMMRCSTHMRKHQLKGELPTTRKFVFYDRIIP